MKLSDKTRTPAGNRRLAKKRVQWLIEHSTSYQLLCLVDSLVLKIPAFAKRQNVIGQCRKPAAHSSTFGFLPTRKAQTKKPKEPEFLPTHRRQK